LRAQGRARKSPQFRPDVKPCVAYVGGDAVVASEVTGVCHEHEWPVKPFSYNPPLESSDNVGVVFRIVVAVAAPPGQVSKHCHFADI
jgi:hypothetical protein